MCDNKELSDYLYFYVRDFKAEKQGIVPIVVDLAEIPRLEFNEILDIEPERMEYLKRVTGKNIDPNIADGYTRISVTCPKCGTFGYLIRNGTDPSNEQLLCNRCIAKRMLEVDQDRIKRKTDAIKALKEEKENKR